MALFRCGGSQLLTNKDVTANSSTDVVYNASTLDGYDGYEQVTVKPFATLGTKSITTNGTVSVIDNNKSYSAVQVNVPAQYSSMTLLWTGNVRGNADNNITVSGISGYSHVLVRCVMRFPASGVTITNGWDVCEDATRMSGAPAESTMEIVLPVLSYTPSFKDYRICNALSSYSGSGRAGSWIESGRLGGTTVAADRTYVHFGNYRTTVLAQATAIDTTWAYLTAVYGLK